MKGFADYIIVGWDEVQREFVREALGIEAPLKGELFKAWLVREGLAEGTAKSYLSNIKRLDKDFFPEVMEEDFFELLKDYLAKGSEKALELMCRMLSTIRKEQKKGNPAMPKSAYSDCYSAFVKYIEFIAFLTDVAPETEVAQDDDDEEESLFEDSHVLYEKELLESRLTFRLTTQDRLTGDEGKVYYPIRLLVRIFGANGEDRQFMSGWLTRSLRNIAVLTEEGELKFKDIEALDIDTGSGEVLAIQKDGCSTKVLTRTANGEIMPMNAKSLQNISIDHSPAIHNILVDKADELQGLAKLTAIIKDYIKANKIGQPERCASVISTELFKQKQEELVALIPELRKDLELIQNSTKLELMNRKENTRKHTN